jgi:hypothetical protein
LNIQLDRLKTFTQNKHTHTLNTPFLPSFAWIEVQFNQFSCRHTLERGHVGIPGQYGSRLRHFSQMQITEKFSVIQAKTIKRAKKVIDRKMNKNN